MGGPLRGTRPAVVLFDIDGTLIRRAGPHHREALVEAVRRVLGLETTTDNIPVQGMLDGKILELMLAAAGAGSRAARRHMPALVAEAQRVYRDRCPRSLRGKVCPGVRTVLGGLRRRGVPTGLVTGNLTRIGWRKMERAGLGHYFAFGAFAEQAEDRAGLVRIALAKARRQGWLGDTTPVWLVGDHENDIRAAQASSIRSLAVATGLSGRHELAACGPDLLVDDLRGLDVGRWIHGGKDR